MRDSTAAKLADAISRPSDARPELTPPNGAVLRHGTVTAVGAAPVGAAPLASNSLEGGAAGAAPTAANSGGASGTAFDVVSGTGLTYDSAQAAHGARALRFVGSESAGPSYVEWAAAVGTRTEIWGRFYAYVGSAYPSAGQALFRAYDGAAAACRVQLNASGKLALLGTSASPQLIISASVVPLNTWIRVEFHFVFSATAGVVELRYYDSADSATITETLSLSGQALTAQATRYQFGQISQTTPGTGTYTQWLDDLAISVAGWPGAAVAVATGGGNAGMVQVDTTGAYWNPVDASYQPKVGDLVYLWQQGPVSMVGGRLNPPGTPLVPVTGSRGGNAALTSLLTQLAARGLIVDNTTA